MRRRRREFAVGDKVVERDQFYELGPNVVVVGEVVGIEAGGTGYWVRGLRVPTRDPAEPMDWDDPHLFGEEELRPFRPRYDKPYFLQRLDLDLLREKSG